MVAESQKHDPETQRIRELAEREGITPAAMAARLHADTAAASYTKEKAEDAE